MKPKTQAELEMPEFGMFASARTSPPSRLISAAQASSDCHSSFPISRLVTLPVVYIGLGQSHRTSILSEADTNIIDNDEELFGIFLPFHQIGDMS